MDKEGPQNEGNEHGSPPEGKVVRLPRDWLGPRDELVPLGPASGDPAPGAAPPPSPTPPPSPEDFWGEGSAQIQDALQGPSPGGVPRDTESGRLKRRPWRQRTTRRPFGWRRWAERPAASTPALPRLRLRRVVMAAAVALVCLVIAVQTLRPSSSHVRHQTSAVGAAHLPVLPPAPHRTTHHQTRPKHHVRRSASKPAVVTQPSAVQASFTPATSQSVNSSGSVSSQGTGSSSGGGESSPPAGPVGPGASFGPGHLG